MSEKLFRSVWFAYASLQHFVDDMSCDQPECGRAPETSIWDGITLAFGKKHLNDKLTPPTKTSPASAVRGLTKYQPKQQLLADVALRRSVRLALKGPSLEGFFDAEDSVTIDSPLPTSPFAQRSAPSSPSKSPSKSKSPASVMLQTQRLALLVKDHLLRLDVVASKLTSECPSLGNLFTKHFGPAAYAADEGSTKKVWRNLFSQVSGVRLHAGDLILICSRLRLRSRYCSWSTTPLCWTFESFWRNPA